MTDKTKDILIISSAIVVGLVGSYFGFKFFKKTLKMVNLVLGKAEKYIGEQEKRGNQGFYNPELEAKIKATGWKLGEPYCAYFVKAMYVDAHPELKSKLNRILTGGTQYTWSLAKNDRTGTVETTKTASVGDIAVWQTYKNGKGKGSGHAGIVKEVFPDKFTTIEANTGATGGREGDGIYVKNRTFNFSNNNGLRLKGFIHLKKKA